MASAPGGAAARSALRRLLRAQRTAFAGDAPMQAVAVAAIREQFAAGAGAGATRDADEVARLLGEAHAAAEFLERNVVQNRLNEKGHYVAGEGAVEIH